MAGNLTSDECARLTDWLAQQADAPVRILATERLSGGAIQENHRLEIDVAGGAWPGRHDLVLRRDAAERAEVEARGWTVAEDGMRLSL